MDSQTQDVLRQILLKLGGLESSVARQDETLKAVQDSLLAVQGDVKAVNERVEAVNERVEAVQGEAKANQGAQRTVGESIVRPKLWVVHKQIKINDASLHFDEGIVTARSSLNMGFSVKGFYSNVDSCNAACRAAFFGYMRDKFAWNEQEVRDNINETVDGPEMKFKNGSVLYYWEGPVIWKHWIKTLSEEEEKEVGTEAYAVISFNPYVVEISE